MQGGIQFSKHGCLQTLQMPQGFGVICPEMTNIITNLLGEQPGCPRASQVAPNNYVWLTKSQPSTTLFFRQNIISSQYLISDHPFSLVSGDVKGQSSLCEGRGCRADPHSAGHGCNCFPPILLSPWRQGLFHNSSYWLPGGQRFSYIFEDNNQINCKQISCVF